MTTDQTKCKGDGCFSKYLCQRYTAPSGLRRQSWFFVTPVKENQTCDFYKPDQARSIIMGTAT